MPDPIKKSTAAPAPAKPVAAVAILGTSTAMGKTTLSDLVASFFQAAGVPTHVVRIESARRRSEFSERNSLIDLDAIEDAASEFGGRATLFEETYRRITLAIDRSGVLVMDCGAGGQNFLLEVAGGMGLAGLMAARGACLTIIVMVTPDGESARQAALLIEEIRQRLPEAQVLLAMNYANPSQRPGLDTAQTRSAKSTIKPLGVPVIEITFCRGQALDVFAGTKRSFVDIIRAQPKDLVKWTGKGEASNLMAQAYLAGWWRAIVDQLAAVWQFDDAEQR